MARYQVDPVRSRVWIEARSSVHPIHSETDGLDGWLELGVQDGGVDLSVPPRAHLELPVDRLRSGNPLEDRELRRRIDAGRYPTISGDLRAMEPTDRPATYRVTGDVTFRGVSRPATDEVTVSFEGADEVRLQGTSEFDIRHFGMEPPRILFLKVAPDVRVTIEVVARRD